ncbi:GNAT family N-acetyltransferase [Dyella sp. GSA-30]|uniref:GNAT family N-acetyltransferase n=1 Tax=Dyella sp. GSA-30 TaxID=2994496 RepID=UPI0024914033|nr:GNAT family N-acetyltransferase [Dyella sp. GSA-30]
MSSPPAIRVMLAEPPLHAELLKLRVRPDQDEFVSPVAVTLADSLLCEGSEPMAILLGDEPIGFYRLEESVRSIAGHDMDYPALGLRSFFIDRDWQGRGWGRAVMTAVIGDVETRHPAIEALVLTVNCRNAAALALYLRAGFVDTGELHLGGRSGPQHLLVRKLRI